jgi:hypothetical protein
MAERRPPSYPPVGDDARFDRIVARGRSLRRRRQLTGVAGAGGALAVVALVAAVAVNLGSDPSSGQDGSFAEAPTTTTSTTLPEEMTIDVLEASPLQIVVTDPEQPTGAGSEQCLGVVVYADQAAATGGGSATHEGWACGLGDGGATAIDLRVTAIDPTAPDLGANVGPCAQTVANSVPPATDVAVGTTTFTLTDLPPGSYWVELAAVSGIGDGCAPEQAPYERENIQTLSTSLTLD